MWNLATRSILLISRMSILAGVVLGRFVGDVVPRGYVTHPDTRIGST
jgi:hypothetical protein